MDNNKISVIVPIYNAGNDLEQCIESIVNQTYHNLEIILVNDGSTDGSIDVCKKWKLKDNRIIVIDKPNGGLASSRNAGLEKASGDYVGFVDHDDFVEPNMYEIMINDMFEKNADIVMCSSWGIYDNGNRIKSYEGYKSFIVDGKEATNRMLKYEKLFCSSVWSKLYKRSAIGEVRFVDEIVLGEDYYFNGRIYPKINKFYFEDKPLYNYRVVEGSMSRSVVNEHFFDKYKVVDLLAEYYENNNYREKDDFNEIRFGISYEILYRLYLYNGDKKQKRKWKRIFKKDAKQYNNSRKKDYLKILMMKHFTSFYVKMTSK